MKLQKEDIEKIIHNTLSYGIADNGEVHFKRFTEPQLSAYKEQSEDWYIRANASASVTFDFITDSSYIALKFDLFPGSSRKWAGFDLYIDGVFHKHKKFDGLDSKLVSFSLPRGEHRVTLYFPWSAKTVVNEIHLSDNAKINPVTKKAKALFLGDSITQGYDTGYPSLSYVNAVAQELNIEAVNQGVGGYYFGIDSIDESLTEYAPDFISVAYGTNDYSRYETANEYERNASAYVEKLVALFPDTKILAILPIYRNDENNNAREKYRNYTLNDARNILTGIYEKYSNVHVLKETNIPHIPQVFVSDYLHPNELGFSFMAKTIIKEILKWL